MIPHPERKAGPFSHFRHPLFLCSLAAVLFVRPFVDSTVIGTVAINIFWASTLLFGVLAITRNNKARWTIIAIAIIAGIAHTGWYLSRDERLLFVFFVVCVVYYLLVAWKLLKDVIFGRNTEVSVDTILCALSVYFLLALTWGLAFMILEALSPGSFTMAGGSFDSTRDLERLLGFSLTTITTLGYGNIAPATPQADALATAEAACGQFYVAIVIARLVAAQVSQPRRVMNDDDARTPNS